MSAYAAPVRDMRFVIEDVVGLGRVAALPGLEGTDGDLLEQILAEAGKLAGGVLAPLNEIGDRQGSRLENGVVRTPDGFADGYRQFIEGGWNGVAFEEEWGGMGLPWLVATALQEMWQASNLAFGLCPLLTQAAIDALREVGSEEQKRLYLPKLVSGEWTGTMNLTEPQAGTDLAAIRTRAEKMDDGSYRLRGQKIFITYGDHDFTDNIVHLVLARSPDGIEGTKGLSLYIVPKFLVNPDGSLGARNDAKPISVEHKLGIHASPTCVMAYGENEGAVGYLVGEENRGIEYMFIMMNNARLAVGLQGLAIAERAYQQAVDYARNRVQSRALQGSAGPVSIIHHPDVRRMLMTMKAQIEAMRGLIYDVAAAIDVADRHPDATERRKAQARVDLLIPVAKAWCTDAAVEICSTGVQVHGGMGFIEETGAAQHYRDARITPIYEGANGIQALDLVGRKVARDGGAAMDAFLVDVDATLAALAGDDPALAHLRDRLSAGRDALARATDWVVATMPKDPAAAASPSALFLKLFGLVAGGWLMARSALAARDALTAGANGDASWLETKLVTARHYADHLLSQAPSLLAAIEAGGTTVMALAEDQF
ncbi:acyl-CoA dehydrogenase [Thalassobaculum fulvum]|uniref:3-methylmercaptopropionyl-CoA dehydrogenase n=1 Tax=Thalassobaculum fulvum TaxID=1633335 RepID=A0A918XRT3_9PROT|nr:acyl-CoA dehydrogenase [Thalassobaculum fulvum]GHD50696.1 acyl-CoA dehydrogenase [Thalassobaculum fulvum]